MSDKTKNFAVPSPKAPRNKRPSTVSVAPSTSRTRVPQSVVKKKPGASGSKINYNSTITGDGDHTILKENALPDFDSTERQIAYGKFLRTMLASCLVDEKIEREDTQVDVQMSQLADRFQKTMDQLDKTNKRLKDISFMAEQKRLLELKNQHCEAFYHTHEQSNAANITQNLIRVEESYLDALHVKNIDFGYNADSGHKQLLDAVNDAIEGLDQIKKSSKLDVEQFKEYEKTNDCLDELEKNRLDLDSLKSNFDARFPMFSEQLLKEASDRIAGWLNDDHVDDDDV